MAENQFLIQRILIRFEAILEKNYICMSSEAITLPQGLKG